MYSLPPNYEPAYQQPLDIDAMLYNMSDSMARAKLSRQISSASTASRGRYDRIFKPNSAGNSPQRRRALNAYRHSRYRTDFSSQEHLQRRSMMTAHELQRPVQIVRPMSWHPSPHNLQHPGFSTPYPYNHPRYSTMTDQQSLATEELATPVMPPSMEDGSVPAYIGLDGSYGICPSSAMDVYNEHPEGFNLDTIYDSCLDFSTHAKPQTMSYDEYQPPPPPPCATQMWTDSLANFPSYTNPPTPDFLPIQHPTDAWTEASEEPARIQPVRKQSMELVGMGLYDSPSSGVAGSGMAGLPQYASEEGSQRASLGKGLKLEETWQPPEDDTSSENDPPESEPQPLSAAPDVSTHTTSSDNVHLHMPLENYGQDYDIQAWPIDQQEQAYPYTLVDYTAPVMAPDLRATSARMYGWD